MSKIVAQFIGRKRLLEKASKVLLNKQHVFVHGPFGIGKTSFAMALSRTLSVPPLIVSFADTPREMSESLLKKLHEIRFRSGKRRSQNATSDYKSFGFIKGQLKKFIEPHHIVIVDNVFNVTPTKLKFLRFLVNLKIQLIVVIESDKYPKDLFLIRSVCFPNTRFEIPRLNMDETRELIEAINKIQIEEDKLDGLTQLLKGYPLMIVERMGQ